jgi:hypothetical protein
VSESPITDICLSLLNIAEQALMDAGRPGCGDDHVHHTPYVPQTACCTSPAIDGWPNGFDGSLTVSVASGFPSLNFPARRSIGDPIDVGGRPTADFWLRLWRCFPTIDSAGNYNVTDAAAATLHLQTDLAVIWAGLQAALCQRDLSDVLPGCQSAVLWEARPIRIQAGCAGWDFHVIASWIPVQLPVI